MYNVYASFLDYSDQPLHFIHMIVCCNYLDFCGGDLIHYAFKLLVSMNVHHLETSVRVNFDDVLGFLYNRILLLFSDLSRCAKFYLPGDGAQESHSLHI